MIILGTSDGIRLKSWRIYRKFVDIPTSNNNKNIILPEKCPAAEAGDGPVVDMTSSSLAANLNILFLSRLMLKLFILSKLNCWKC